MVLSVDGGALQRRIDAGLEPYIERVFDNDLVELDAAGTLAAAEANEHAVITAETRRLQIAAHWADLHPGDAIAQSRVPGAEHAVRLGGEGTPTVAEFTGSAELDDPDQQPAGDDLNRDHPAAGEDAKATAEPDDTSEAACDEDLPPASDPASSQEARHRSLQIIGNLGPHIRYHHRIKTFGGWQVCQPEPGIWLWRSPHHRIYLVNPSGTHPLGNTEFAQTIWRATADPPAAVMSEPS